MRIIIVSPSLQTPLKLLLNVPLFEVESNDPPFIVAIPNIPRVSSYTDTPFIDKVIIIGDSGGKPTENTGILFELILKVKGHRILVNDEFKISPLNIGTSVTIGNGLPLNDSVVPTRLLLVPDPKALKVPLKNCDPPKSNWAPLALTTTSL